MTLLKKVKISAEHGNGTYKRSAFKHWIRKNGKCNTRAVVLKQESKKRTRQNSRCTVLTGRWVSPYDGVVVKRANRLDIDHAVALKEAGRSGARSWKKDRRQAFANDTDYMHTLVAVSSASNDAKGDTDPSDWMPQKGKCAYLAKWVAVKYRWDLAMDRGEYRFVKRQVARCGRPATMITKPAKAKVPEQRRRTGGGGGGAPSRPGSGYNCPDGYPIKGNADSMIYHVPGGQYYDRTKPEECFKTESAAVAAGYRRSQR